MILFVIVMHVSMTYMLYSPSWWYVISDKGSPVLVVIVNVLDIFMMPVLFFISGYFTPASYAKKGFVSFLKDKIRHIFLPWIVGIILIVPLYPLFSGKSINDIIGSLKENVLYLFDSQGHLWYLGVLFLFLLAYAFVSYFKPPSNIRTTSSNRKSILLLLVSIVISAMCAYLSTAYITPYDNWLSFAYIFSLKPAKIAIYICAFILGVYARQTNWFTKDGWMPRISTWSIWAISTTTCYMVLRLLIIPNYDIVLLEKILPVLDAICSFTTLVYALLIGIKFQKSRIASWLVGMSPYSYGIYWIHIPVMILYLQFINELNFPIFIKWISGILVTCIGSWLISKYVLKRVPLFKDMF